MNRIKKLYHLLWANTNSEMVSGIGSLHIWKGTIYAEKYIQLSEQHIISVKALHTVFQQDNAKTNTASMTTA